MTPPNPRLARPRPMAAALMALPLGVWLGTAVQLQQRALDGAAVYGMALAGAGLLALLAAWGSRRAAPGRKRGYRRSEAPRKMAAAGTVRVRVNLPPQEEEVVYAQPEVKMRVCLMCLNKFQSQGRHNRICPTCKGSADYATGSSTPDFTFKVVT